MSWQAFRQLSILSLIFVLGAVVGHRFIEPGKIPGLAAPEWYQEGGLVAQPSLINLDPPADQANLDFGQFWEVWQILERDYLDTTKIDREKMVFGAIRGLASSLGDPYTVFLPPEQDKRAAEDLAGSFYGVGIELGYISNTLAVVAPLRGMPADQQGVKAGDLILRVADPAKNFDEETSGWSLSEAVDKIRGERGSIVQLTLFRPEESPEPFTVDIKRDEIIIPSVEVEFVEHDGKLAAHLIVSRFGERTDREWNEAVGQVLSRRDQLSGVVLDMRNNPGGYFEQSITVASEFVGRGTIVTQKGKTSSKDFPALGNGRLQDIPLNILVNRGSASASEIVAGALRDLREVPLIGETTFGKGRVQDRRSLRGGGGLHVTVAKWLLPAGSTIDHEGLPVDHEVENDRETDQDEVLLRAIELL